MRTFVLAVLLVLILPCSAWADVKFTHASPPYAPYGSPVGTMTVPDVVVNVVYESAAAELLALTKRLPYLRHLDFTLYLPERTSLPWSGLASQGWIAVYPPKEGFVVTDMGIIQSSIAKNVVTVYPHPVGVVEVSEPVEAPYIEAYARFVTAHEIGHLMRQTMVPDSALREYVAWRINRYPRGVWQTDSEEVFAEDFRAIYGSSYAKLIGPSRLVPPLTGEELLQAQKWFAKWLEK